MQRCGERRATRWVGMGKRDVRDNDYTLTSREYRVPGCSGQGREGPTRWVGGWERETCIATCLSEGVLTLAACLLTAVLTAAAGYPGCWLQMLAAGCGRPASGCAHCCGHACSLACSLACLHVTAGCRSWAARASTCSSTTRRAWWVSCRRRECR